MPPASTPIASILAACRSASSDRFRSVMSRWIEDAATMAPVTSRMGDSVREISISLPSFLHRTVS
jgi:hypothetical protein